MSAAAVIADAVSLGVDKITWAALREGGWKCTVSGPDIPPCQGRGETGALALLDLVNFLRRIA